MAYFLIYKTVEELPNDWDTLATRDIFLQRSYLQALENASPKTISLYFIGVFNNDFLVGIAIIQRVELYARDMFRSEPNSKLKAILKDSISSILKGNILVVGNLTHTGQHGIFFEQEHISLPQFLKTLFEAIETLNDFIKKQKNKTIRAVLFKDYFLEDSIHLEARQFKNQQFYHASAQPNMLFEVKSTWNSMADYLADLKPKYKTRYRRARKKLNAIEQRELLLEDIERQSDELYRLYQNVCTNAAFNTFVLPKNHFLSLKFLLKDNFRIFGYYLKNELVGFYTVILNNKTLETYFLGYDEAHQYDNQLYLNMLYDMIDFGIKNQFKEIVYARTAMEIKSSVGASPKSMTMYIKHTNAIINFLLQPIFKLMNPLQDWVERHPFK